MDLRGINNLLAISMLYHMLHLTLFFKNSSLNNYRECLPQGEELDQANQ